MFDYLRRALFVIHFLFLEVRIMRIILDSDKKTITVPWNYAKKIDEMNKIGADSGA